MCNRQKLLKSLNMQTSLEALGNAGAERAGGKGCVTLWNHPGSEVGDKVQTLQRHNTGGNHVTAGEEETLDITDEDTVAVGDIASLLDNLAELVGLQGKDNIEKEQHIESNEVQHRSVEMDGEEARQPLAPGRLPFG